MVSFYHFYIQGEIFLIQYKKFILNYKVYEMNVKISNFKSWMQSSSLKL